MADSTVEITGPFDRGQKLLKLIDNGDGTYSLASSEAATTNGLQKTQIVDLDGHIVNVQSINGEIAGDEYGAIAISVIHGKTTGGGGGWVDVKVNPSGALTTESSVVSSTLPTGAATSVKQSDGSQKTQITDPDGDVAQVIAGANTGVKGLRVYGGPTDPISDIPVVMLYDHHQLHEGEIFRWSVYIASLASGTSKDIRIVVPNINITTNAVTQCPHFRFEFISSLGGNAYLYETPTFTGNGTQRTAVAMERNGTYTSKLQVHEDPTVSAVGTQLWQGLLLASKQSAGGTNSSEMEFVLKNNTSYLVRFTSAAAQNQVLIRLMWYEDLGV